MSKLFISSSFKNVLSHTYKHKEKEVCQIHQIWYNSLLQKTQLIQYMLHFQVFFLHGRMAYASEFKRCRFLDLNRSVWTKLKFVMIWSSETDLEIFNANFKPQECERV